MCDICFLFAAPPHFEVRPPEIEYVKLGEGVFISCKAAGTPTPAIEWYKVSLNFDFGNRVRNCFTDCGHFQTTH